MNKKIFHDRPDNEGDLSAFEQQLRSIEPTPPQTAWQDLPQLLEQQQKVSVCSDPGSAPVPSRLTAGWLRIATHAAAILIGVGLGALWVVMLQPAVATVPPVDVGPPPYVANEQELPDAIPKYSATQQLASHQEFQGQRHRMSAKFGYRNVGSWPLTPLTRDTESRPWHRMPQDFGPVASEAQAATIEPSALDKPMSAPELMREMLNEQAHLPTQRGGEVGRAL